jgi:hypothetical protein
MVELLPGVPPALLHNAQLDHRKVKMSFPTSKTSQPFKEKTS